MRTHQADCLGDTLEPVNAGRQEQHLVLVWAELGAVRARDQDRNRRVGLALTPAHAEGALRAWGMEVWVPTLTKVTQPVLGHTSVLLGSCTL